MAGNYFIEVGHYHIQKHNQRVCGDTFLSQKLKGENRVISTLADGLGSGIKASVLATLTSSMAARFIASDVDLTSTAKIIMNTLPICSERKIGYSTFTIVDVAPDGLTKIIEYDNPSFIYCHGNQINEVAKTETIITAQDREMHLFYSTFQMHAGDRIIFFSDGIAQAGLGNKQMPLGWGHDKIKQFVEQKLSERSEISARELSEQLVMQAHFYDSFKAKDDISCGVIYYRHPRKTLILTGPPYNKNCDQELADIANHFNGTKIICGGTTAGIIGRILGLPLRVNLKSISPDLPPESELEGFDLVTEGTITLSKVFQYLENEQKVNQKNPAAKIVSHLLDSDIVNLVVGTKINEAHQDPSLPQELEIRRNIVRQICQLLENKYLKETHIQFI